MLLACDIGNSSVKIGIFDGKNRIAFGLYPKEKFSCSTDILSLTTKSNLRFDQFDKAIVSSVVPNISDELIQYIKTNFKIEPTVINNDSKLSIKIDEAFKENIGPDILVMSSYAYSMYKDECIIISLGTATVFSYVNGDGILKGCAFAPGFKSFSSSLSEKSTLLPEFTPEYQVKYLATNTIDAMSVGSFNGFVGMVNDIVRNIRKQYCYAPKIILCGGHSDKVKDYIFDIDFYEKDFVTSGLQYISNND